MALNTVAFLLFINNYLISQIHFTYSLFCFPYKTITSGLRLNFILMLSTNAMFFDVVEMNYYNTINKVDYRGIIP